MKNRSAAKKTSALFNFSGKKPEKRSEQEPPPCATVSPTPATETAVPLPASSDLRQTCAEPELRSEQEAPPAAAASPAPATELTASAGFPPLPAAPKKVQRIRLKFSRRNSAEAELEPPSEQGTPPAAAASPAPAAELTASAGLPPLPAPSRKVPRIRLKFSRKNSAAAEQETSPASHGDPLIKMVRVLGAGSFGVVHLVHYEGYESDLFAMKSAPEGTEEALSLAKEMRVYQTLQGCPGITKCYTDFTRQDPGNGNVYYSLLLDFAPAGTLGNLIERNGGRPFPEQAVAAYARMIFTGLHSMHIGGYVHCDIKPENILAFPPVGGPDNLYQLKLADFGLVEEPDNRLPAKFWKGRFRGTPSYMSPESVRDGIISRALDIWSVGCIILQMLNGWESSWSPLVRTSEDVMSMLHDRKFDPMQYIPPSASKGANSLLFKCLTRVPGYSRVRVVDLLENDPFLAGGTTAV